MIIAFTSDLHTDNSKENFMVHERIKRKLKQIEPNVFIIALLNFLSISLGIQNIYRGFHHFQ